MRKLSLLSIAIVAVLLVFVSTAGAVDRYAAPTQHPSADINICAQDEPCSIENALDVTKMEVGDNVRLAPGTYTVSTPLVLSAEFAGLRGSGATAADVVINSSASGTALTLQSNSEAEKFTLNASAGKGLNLESGVVDHLAINSSAGHACTGTDAYFVNVLCRTTGAGPYSGFQRSSGSGSASLSLINSTFVGASGWYPISLEAMGTSTYEIDFFSSVAYSPGNQTVYLNRGTNGYIGFSPASSYYEKTHSLVDGINPVNEPASGTNVWGDPKFVSSTDFTPGVGSVLTNAGAVNGRSGDKDLAGNAREIGGVADIGAYESSAIPVVIPPPGDGTTTPPPADTTKPALTILKKPKSKTTSKKLNVTFKADETATFLCRLDKGKFKTCKSPYKKTVKAGKHKLQIKATDAAGNVSSVKTIKWTVKKK